MSDTIHPVSSPQESDSIKAKDQLSLLKAFMKPESTLRSNLKYYLLYVLLATATMLGGSLIGNSDTASISNALGAYWIIVFLIVFTFSMRYLNRLQQKLEMLVGDSLTVSLSYAMAGLSLFIVAVGVYLMNGFDWTLVETSLVWMGITFTLINATSPELQLANPELLVELNNRKVD